MSCGARSLRVGVAVYGFVGRAGFPEYVTAEEAVLGSSTSANASHVPS